MTTDAELLKYWLDIASEIYFRGILQHQKGNCGEMQCGHVPDSIEIAGAALDFCDSFRHTSQPASRLTCPVVQGGLTTRLRVPLNCLRVRLSSFTIVSTKTLMKTLVVFLIGLVLFLATARDAAATKLKPETLKVWDTYVQLTEKRIDAELTSTAGFLRKDFVKPAEASDIAASLKSGDVYIKKMITLAGDGRELRVPDGMIHHWFGSVFVPNVQLETLLNFVKNYDQHHRYFKEVEASNLVSRDGDTFKVFFRFVRKKVVTVHYNTDHTVIYRHDRDGRESSRSFTTRIAELQNPGTPQEMEKPVGDDSGFLWRLNSYWRFKPQDGGVIVECESISLSRSIPFGLGWLIKGFVESVPQESLESTLTSIRDGVGK